MVWSFNLFAQVLQVGDVHWGHAQMMKGVPLGVKSFSINFTLEKVSKSKVALDSWVALFVV